MERKVWVWFGFVVILVWAMLMSGPEAQDTSCISQLAPCLNYLNGNKEPPRSCCDPLKSIIKSNPQCLCRMASNRGSSQARQAGIDVNEAQQLPARCGQNVNPIACLASSPGNKNMVRNAATRLSSKDIILLFALSVVVQIIGH